MPPLGRDPQTVPRRIPRTELGRPAGDVLYKVEGEEVGCMAGGRNHVPVKQEGLVGS